MSLCYCICHSQDTAFETLLALNYNSFILTVAIIGAGIYSIEAGEFNVFDSHAVFFIVCPRLRPF